MSAGKFLQDTMESEMVVNSHLVMCGNFRARKNARKNQQRSWMLARSFDYCWNGEQSDADIVELPWTLNIPLKFRFRNQDPAIAPCCKHEDCRRPVHFERWGGGGQVSKWCGWWFGNGFLCWRFPLERFREHHLLALSIVCIIHNLLFLTNSLVWILEEYVAHMSRFSFPPKIFDLLLSPLLACEEQSQSCSYVYECAPLFETVSKFSPPFVSSHSLCA